MGQLDMSQMDHDTIMILTRSAILIVASLTSMMSIYLGYRLYRLGLESQTSGGVETTGVKFNIQSQGPGIFFAAFGMIMIVVLVNRQVEFEDSVPVVATPTVLHPNQLSQTQGFLRIADTSDNKKCLYYIRTRKFASGSEETAANYNRSLADAKAALTDSIKLSKSKGDAEAVQRLTSSRAKIDAILSDNPQ